MNDTNNNDGQTQEAVNTAQETTPAPPVDDGKEKIRERLSIVGKERNELKEKLEAYEAKEKEREEAEALKRGEFEKLLNDEKAAFEKYKAETDVKVKQMERQTLETEAKRLLSDLTEPQQFWAMSKLPTEAKIEDLKDWVTSFRTEQAAVLSPPPAGVRTGTGGVPNTDSVQPAKDLDERLASKDLHVRTKAIEEKKALRAAGKLPNG